MADGPIELMLAMILRSIWFLVSEMLWGLVCYVVGYSFLKAVTFGRYPKTFVPRDLTEFFDSFVAAVGFVVLLSVALVLYYIVG